MKTPEEIYDILDKALAEKKAAGFEIIEGFGDSVTSCCAITAIGDAKEHMHDLFAPAVKLLETPEKELWAIVSGFDDSRHRVNMPLYQVGQRLRAKYLS